MDWGSPEFVLAIIAMVTLGGILKTWARASHGVADPDESPGRRHRRATREDSGEVVKLKAENRQLTDRLEASEDRLAVLERIVTDRSYSLASEIEALRDTGRDAPATNGTDNGVPLDMTKKEKA